MSLGSTIIKKAIITGASSGIGAAVASRFLAADYRVLNLSRRACPVIGVDNIQADLMLRYHEATFADELKKYADGADSLVLVHNACLHGHDNVANLTNEQFAQVLTLNLQVPNALNRILIPCMKSGSAILYVGSTLSEKAVAGAFSYVVSKHALVGMMRATTQDLADTGIHSVCICPGFTDTEMLRRHIGDDVKTERMIAARSTHNRLIRPEEIATMLMTAATEPVLNGAVIQAGLGQKEN